MTISVNKNTVIAFDLDDTLYNEIDYLISAFHFIANKLDKQNHTKVFDKMFSLYKEKNDVFLYLSEKYNVAKNLLINDYRDHFPDIKPFNNVIDLFTGIRNNNGQIAIITDGRKLTQINKIKSLGLYDLVDKIIISEEIGTEKPNPLNYIAVEEFFNKKQYTYIADNIKKDFVAPNSRGWMTIRLNNNGKNIHFCETSSVENNFLPQYSINSFSELKIQ